MNEKIMIIDDEVKLLKVMKDYLKSESYKVITGSRGNRAIDIFSRESPDFVILDLMLPDIPGEEICQIIRKKSNVPILMLSAKSDFDSKIKGFNIGADDYMTKPFSPRELVSRIKAILRRSHGDTNKSEVLEFNNGDLIIDIPAHNVKKRNENVDLTPTEFKILSSLAKNPKKVFTRNRLINIALGYDFEGYSRTIDTHVKNLRRKIEDDYKAPKYVLTVYGVGYKFEGN